jgi:hypothetical protein
MATLIKRKPLTLRELLWPPGSGSIIGGVLRRVLAVFVVGVIGGVVASATTIIAYLVFSGTIVNWLALILVASCAPLGQCSNFPAMLSALASGIVMIVLIFMVAFVPLFVKDDPYELPSGEISLATLILNWYCLSDKSRDVMLTLLESSDTALDQTVVNILRNEHKAIKEVMSGGG